jgi:hypothetical protein
MRVKHEEGNAKFDGKSKTLRITLPVIKENRPVPKREFIEEKSDE